MPKNPHADFTPTLEGYSGITPFRFWCQTALPLTYDDSLSYYELLNKVVNYLNHTIEDLTNVENNTSELAEAYDKLQKYVNDYFDDIDIEAELRNVLDGMVEDGTLDALLDPIVAERLPGVVENQIPGVVAEQIDDAVEEQIDGVVGQQLPPIVDANIGEEVSQWLEENVDPVGSAVLVDSTLSISGAAADAKVTGDEIRALKTQLNPVITFTCTDGSYIDPNGNVQPDQNSCYTDFIPVIPGDKILFKNLKLTGTRSICVYNDNQVKIDTVITGSDATEYTVTIPENGAFIRATGNAGTPVTANYVDISNAVHELKNKYINMQDDINKINRAIGDYRPVIGKTDEKYVDPNGNIIDSANSCASDLIPVIPGQSITLGNLKLNGTRSVYGYNLYGDPVKKIAGSSDDVTLTYTVEDGIYFIRATGAVGVAPTVIYSDLLDTVRYLSGTVSIDSVHVAKTGNDETGDGTENNPFATISRAMKTGLENIYISAGVYNETIDLDNSQKKHIRFINNSKDSKVVFKPDASLITTTETLVIGYTKVYSAATTKVFSNNNLWIYQDGVADAVTEISANERHPAQKGRAYRCPDTKIIKCTETSLNDALAEIENSSEYKWFIDSGVIYFSRPQAITSEHPLRADFGYTLFNNAGQDNSVELYGIDTVYMRINLNDMKNAKAVNCSARNVFGAGAFTYSSRNTELVRCEAACCCNGVNGDGFNGAATLTGDADGTQTTTYLEDCWSHDNRDDGYSDHNRSDGVMRGGLYEYNNKAGVTPSTGENFAAYDVLSRKNMRGFFLTSNIGDGSKIPSAMLYNCVAEDNTGRADSSGFTINTPSGGTMTLFNCITINSPTGYRSETGSTMILIECKTKDVNAKKGGAGTITVMNGDSVA